jgi:pyruvate dehydrogenase E2 component (dihydrolipoamide acetyltransferase)
MAEEHQINLAGVVGSGPHGRITREDVAKLIPSANPPSNGNGRHAAFRALPKVRQLARAEGVDLTEVPATGTQGQVTLADLQRHLLQRSAPPSLPEGAHEVALSRSRQIIAQRLSQSMREAPHFYVTGEFDLEAALARLQEVLPSTAPRINDLLQYLTVQCLVQVPELNATFEDGHLYQHDAVNLALAVAREDGLITPVIQGAERFSLPGLAKESRALISRARENRLQPNDIQGGTFTLSNLGIIKQVDHFTAVINPPQVAILAVGTVKPRPVVVNGGLFIHHTVHLTLSGDHRVVDGMHLGRFMATFQAELERFSG